MVFSKKTMSGLEKAMGTVLNTNKLPVESSNMAFSDGSNSGTAGHENIQ